MTKLLLYKESEVYEEISRVVVVDKLVFCCFCLLGLFVNRLLLEDFDEVAFNIGNDGSDEHADGGSDEVLWERNDLRSWIELRLFDEIFFSILIPSLSDDGLDFCSRL